MARRGQQVGHIRVPATERFAALYIPEPNSGCWIWLGAILRHEKPYGQFWHERRMWLAHRASYALHRGPIPEGMLVCHRCDNPTCVNPDHLFLGTGDDNLADRTRKGRTARGEKIASAKLTAAQVATIRVSSRDATVVGAQMGISARHVNSIRAGKCWKHLAS